MEYIHSDLGNRQGGELVEFTLKGNAANVRLLDSNNFHHYHHGRQCSFVGGVAERALVTLRIPHAGHWYAVVDMRGLGGKVNASIRVRS